MTGSADMIGDMEKAKIIITNYHAFKLVAVRLIQKYVNNIVAYW